MTQAKPFGMIVEAMGGGGARRKRLPKLVIAGIGKPMMEAQHSLEQPEEHRRVPEARYAYYRRCQVFRKGGEQCKAPAEKGSLICYAHAGQLATAVRRERERQAVLEQAVTQMRKHGRPECEMADLFMDFKGINVTLAVMAQALIDGRIDCKTAGRLVVHLQTVSKLLRLYHRGHRGTQRTATALTTKDTKKRKEEKNLPLINTDDTDRKKTAEAPEEQPKAERNWVAYEREERRIALVAKVLAIASKRGWAHAPPELLRAA